VPVLGVCLGHQAIAEVYGGVVDRAEELLHGRTSLVHHAGDGVFQGLPDPFTATRYHSLAVVDGTLPAEVEVTARTEGGVIMGLRHRDHDVEGVQFHPESVLTQGGHRMLANWLQRCGGSPSTATVDDLEADVERLRLSAV
jgi:para-aminobenzoate synthetase component 2